MKQVFRFLLVKHPFRTLATIALLGLMIHWGYFGFLLLSVPALAVWRNLLP